MKFASPARPMRRRRPYRLVSTSVAKRLLVRQDHLHIVDHLDLPVLHVEDFLVEDMVPEQDGVLRRLPLEVLHVAEIHHHLPGLPWR